MPSSAGIFLLDTTGRPKRTAEPLVPQDGISMNDTELGIFPIHIFPEKGPDQNKAF